MEQAKGKEREYYIDVGSYIDLPRIVYGVAEGHIVMIGAVQCRVRYLIPRYSDRG